MRQIQFDLHFIEHYTNVFFKNWGSYLVFFFGIGFSCQSILFPLFNHLTNLITSHHGIRNTLANQPTSILLFFLEFCLILASLLLFFIFIVVSVTNISRDTFELRLIWQETWRNFFKQGVLSYLLFVGYLVILYPLVRLLFLSSFLSNFVLPQFFLDDFYTKTSYAFGILLVYLVLLYFGIRLLYALPLIILKSYRPMQAIKRSWNLTKQDVLEIFQRGLVIFIFFAIIAYFLTGISYLIQIIFKGSSIFFEVRLFSLTFLEICNNFLVAWISFLGLQLMLPAKLFSIQPAFMHINKIAKKRRYIRILALIILGIWSVFLLHLTTIQLQDFPSSQPVISFQQK